MFLFIKLELNSIGDKGCKIISTVNLPKLKELNLSNAFSTKLAAR